MFVLFLFVTLLSTEKNFCYTPRFKKNTKTETQPPTLDQSELHRFGSTPNRTEDFKPSGISAMYESNFSVAVLPSNVMPPPLPPSPSYTMPPPPPPLHIEMPQLWQESEAADGICFLFPAVSFCFPLFMLDFSRFWEANNLGRKKFQPVCQWLVWISCFSLHLP